MICAKKCPVSAITGEKGKVHSIDKKLCTKCGTCVDNCKFEAIKGGNEGRERSYTLITVRYP